MSVSAINYFTPETSFSQAAPLFPYMIKALKVLPEMFFQNKLSDYTGDCGRFLDEFEERSLESLSTKLNPSPSLLNQARAIVIAKVEEVRGRSHLSLQCLERDLESTFKNTLNSLEIQNLVEVTDLNFKLPSSELRALKMDELGQESLHYRCAEYAFYVLKEPRIIPWIRGDRANLPLFTLSLKRGVDFLEEWGYRAVKTPKQGDLIAYIDNGTRAFSHVGIIQGDGTVLSKTGSLPVFKHPIKQVSTGYGSGSYICFRKSGGDGIADQMEDLLKSAEEGARTFTHPACYSPFSKKGTVEELKKGLVKIARQKQENASPLPPYGKGYYQEVARKVQEDALEEPFSGDIFPRVQGLVEGVIRTTNPMTT
jgi:hypothetical protein